MKAALWIIGILAEYVIFSADIDMNGTITGRTLVVPVVIMLVLTIQILIEDIYYQIIEEREENVNDDR